MPALVEGDDAVAGVPEQPGRRVPLAGVPGEPVEQKDVTPEAPLLAPVTLLATVTLLTRLARPAPVATREPHAVTDHEPL
ncbi:hypothetical protein ACFVFF_14855 [Streptomyces sp. NPDC057680]|uniref:hypothetical protein n=1 Tax=Streptomyces sp. NPDC057680 TaxID=3346208 RepID=UPI0036A882C0